MSQEQVTFAAKLVVLPYKICDTLANNTLIYIPY